MPESYSNYIDGEWVESVTGNTFVVRNPADTNDTIGHFQNSGPKDADRAVEAASEAQDSWAATPAPERCVYLTTVAERVEEHKTELAETLTRGEGKTIAEAQPEVQRVADTFRYYAQVMREYNGDVKWPSSEDATLSTRREPLGVASLITPWNFPIVIPAWKLATALVTGNTVVLKPASNAPNVSRKLFECLDEAGLPPGVANYVTGSGNRVGMPLVEHDDVAAVSFTGSAAVGTSIYETATQHGKRVQTEMGGKNPAVVMPSADVGDAVQIVGAGAFGVTGQACTATSRAIVHKNIYDDFVAGITDYAASIEVGPGLEGADMGPQVTQRELDTTMEYIRIGESEGATLETGGSRVTDDGCEDGFFVEPTVFSDVDNEMQIAREEIFGPVLAVIPVADFEEAVTVANDTKYGLSASIVTDNLREANRFVDQAETGLVKVNEQTTGTDPHVPFGGVKQSSSDTYREQGKAGLDFFTTTKTVYKNY